MPRVARKADAGRAMTTQTHPAETTQTYVFDQAWQRELERLRSLEVLFDPSSRRHLDALGIGPGWRCLEVGCGAGSMALWLADRVGPSGSVLATDLDPRFLVGHGRDNLSVIRHDILADPLTPASFDLIHTRAVVIHLLDRAAAIRRLAAALKPGGILVIEDVDFGSTAAAMIGRYTVPSAEAATCQRVYEAAAAVFDTVGADATFGSYVANMLIAAGLQEVTAEVHAQLVSGSSAGSWIPLSVEHMRRPMLASGLVTESDLDRSAAFFREPDGRYLTPFMITASGRRSA